MAKDPYFSSSSSDQPTAADQEALTNPWDSAVVGSPTAQPTDIFDAATQAPSGTQPSSAQTQQLNQRFSQATAGHTTVRSLDAYQLPQNLSPTQLRQFLQNISSVVNAKGQLIGEQKLILPVIGSTHGKPFKTSSDLLYSERANDAKSVLTQTEITALVADAAQRLAELDPTSALAGTKRDRVLQELGEGSGDTISRHSIGSEKSQQELRELLETAEYVADNLIEQEKSKEAAAETTAATAEKSTEAGGVDDTAEDPDSHLGAAHASESDSDSGGSGEGATAEETQVQEPEPPEPENQTTPEDQPPEESQPENQPETAQNEVVLETEVELSPAEALVAATAVGSATSPTSSKPPAPTTASATTSSSGAPATATQATTTSTAPTPHSAASDPELISLLTEKFSHDYLGRLVGPNNIPPELNAALQSQITEYLSKNYSPQELEKIHFSQTLRTKAIEKLHENFKTSPTQTATREFLEQFAQGSSASESQRRDIAEALQKQYSEVLGAQNPYHDFIQKASQIIGPGGTSAVLIANLHASQTALEASVIAIGAERTQKLLENASPEQLRSLLNIPGDFPLSAGQASELKRAIVAVTPQMVARLAYDSSPSIRDGLFSQKPGGVVGGVGSGSGVGRSITPHLEPTAEEQEAIDNLKKIGPDAGRAVTHAPRGTQKNLERVQKLLQGSWDSLDRRLQEHLYAENGIPVPQDLHAQDRLPFTMAFIQYTQKDIDAQKRWLDLVGINDARSRESTHTALATGADYLKIQEEIAIAGVLGKNMREEFLQALGPDAYATHATAIASITQDGTFTIPDTMYLSAEDVAQLSGFSQDGVAPLTPDTDFNSMQELWNSSGYLEQNPEMAQQYAAAQAGGQGFMSNLRNRFGRGGSASPMSRAQALRASLAKTAQTAKDLKRLGMDLAGSLAGSPLSMAKLARSLLTTKTGRKVLAVGAGLSALPMLPGLAALMQAANWWNSAATAAGNAWSAVSGGASSASAGASAGSGALSSSAATAAGDATGGGLTGATIGGAGVPVQTAGYGIFSSFAGITFSSMFGFVVFSTFMVLMVINGAFLIPTPTSTTPDPTRANSPSESLYLSLHKKVLETKFENDVDNAVQYNVIITPKAPYSIEIVSVTDVYSFFGEGERTQLETLVSPIAKEDFPAEIFSAKAEKAYAVTMNGVDTLVTNTFTLKYNVYDTTGNLVKADQSLSNAATVMIGKVTGGCFEFMEAGILIAGPGDPSAVSRAWTESDKLLILQAFVRRAGNSPQFLSLLCSSGPVEIARLGNSIHKYGGWDISADRIAFYDLGLGNLNNTEYTLIHELGHVIGLRNDTLRTTFGTVITNTHCFSYPFPSLCQATNAGGVKTHFVSESFAEAVVLNVVYKTKYFSAYSGPYDFPNRDPAEYAWIRDNIYGGMEF